MLKSSRGRVTIAAASILGLAAALLPIAVLSLDRAAALTDPTTTDDQNGTIPGETSLREAIGEASSTPGDDIIELAAGETYVLDICDRDGMDNAWGDLNHDPDADDALTINGNGATIEQTCFGHRVLRDRSAGQLTLDNVTITGGTEIGSGGGVKTDGPATLQNGTHIIGNTATGGGGGIYMRDLPMAGKPDPDDGIEVAQGASGDLLITGGSTVNDNDAAGNGGGVHTYGTVTVSGASMVDGNIAGTFSNGDEVDGADLPEAAFDCSLYGFGGYGGGIYAHSSFPLSVTVTGASSVSGNVACYAGGGLHVASYGAITKSAPADADLLIEGASKVNDNFAHSDGGGIHARMTTAITGGSTVDGNQAGFGFDFEVAPADADPDLCLDGAPVGGGRNGGGIFYYPIDGGDGAVYVVGSSVSGNVACGDGGGIYYYASPGNRGLTSVTEGSTINVNTAVGDFRRAPSEGVDEAGGPSCGGCGGGIYGSDVEVFDSQVAMNDAGAAGGGIISTGHTLAVRSGINENHATFAGGGLAHFPIIQCCNGGGASRAAFGGANPEVIRLNNTTLSSNRVDGVDGGGIFVPESPFFAGRSGIGQTVPYTVTLEFATVVENAALDIADQKLGPALGGFGPIDNVSSPILSSTASVIASPAAGHANCWQNDTSSGGYNFSDDASCGLTGTGDVEDGGDPGLGALTGTTGWHVPSPVSPLVDVVPSTLGAAAVGVDDAACDDTDQRGMARPSGLGCDVGAAELQFPTAIDNTGATTDGVAITIPVLDNDEDPDGILDPSTVAVVDTVVAGVGASSPSHGTAVVNADGSITYTSNAGFGGVDTFGYTVMITGTTTTVAANVTITVTAQPVEVTPTPTPAPTRDTGPDTLQPQFTG